MTDVNGQEDDESSFVSASDELIEARILHVLTVWPKLNPSMLQVGIGTALSPKMWHPVLERLIAEGKVVKYELSGRGPTGRDQIFTVLRLSTTE